MVQNTEPVKRPRGRPQQRGDDETLRLIVEAAAAAFQANGYASTSISTVAQRAGVSTKTLYRLVPSKAELFEDVVKDRIRLFMAGLDGSIGGAEDLAAGLERVLLALGLLTLSPAVVAMTRLVIAECDRFPEIARTFHDQAIMPVNRSIGGWLRRQVERGTLAIDDIEAATSLLRGMMMEPQRIAMLRLAPPPDDAAIAARAKLCAAVFLDGLRAG